MALAKMAAHPSTEAPPARTSSNGALPTPRTCC